MAKSIGLGRTPSQKFAKRADATPKAARKPRLAKIAEEEV